MPDWLCIHLAGPMASFGEEAGNVQRGTADRPTRSSLLGLAGAALGIRRDDGSGQAALTNSFSTSTQTLDPGVLMSDFHTFEGIQQTRTQFTTRAQALAEGNRNTSITRREYRTGGQWLAAYRLKINAGFALDQLAQAFRQPVFTLWLGRKSCPLSYPLWPVVLSATDVEMAFAHYIVNELADKHHRLPDGKIVATDDHLNIDSAKPMVRRNRRVDQPVDRKAWTFRAREEFEFMTGVRPAEGGANGT